MEPHTPVICFLIFFLGLCFEECLRVTWGSFLNLWLLVTTFSHDIGKVLDAFSVFQRKIRQVDIYKYSETFLNYQMDSMLK